MEDGDAGSGAPHAVDDQQGATTAAAARASSSAAAAPEEDNRMQLELQGAIGNVLHYVVDAKMEVKSRYEALFQCFLKRGFNKSTWRTQKEALKVVFLAAFYATASPLVQQLLDESPVHGNRSDFHDQMQDEHKKAVYDAHQARAIVIKSALSVLGMRFLRHDRKENAVGREEVGKAEEEEEEEEDDLLLLEEERTTESGAVEGDGEESEGEEKEEEEGKEEGKEEDDLLLLEVGPTTEAEGGSSSSNAGVVANASTPIEAEPGTNGGSSSSAEGSSSRGLLAAAEEQTVGGSSSSSSSIAGVVANASEEESTERAIEKTSEPDDATKKAAAAKAFLYDFVVRLAQKDPRALQNFQDLETHLGNSVEGSGLKCLRRLNPGTGKLRPPLQNISKFYLSMGASKAGAGAFGVADHGGMQGSIAAREFFWLHDQGPPPVEGMYTSPSPFFFSFFFFFPHLFRVAKAFDLPAHCSFLGPASFLYIYIYIYNLSVIHEQVHIYIYILFFFNFVFCLFVYRRNFS